MNFNNFTIKSQEAIQKAVELTRTAGQQAIEPVHLLKAVVSEGDSLVKFIFQKIGANLPLMLANLDREIDTLPKVSGSEPYLSRTSNDVLQRALDIAKKNGDEYVTLEAMLQALFAGFSCDIFTSGYYWTSPHAPQPLFHLSLLFKHMYNI